MISRVSPTDPLQARAGTLWQRLGDESVLLDLERGVYYELNAAGTRVWELLQQPRCTADLKAALASEYDVEPERCAGDVEQLVAELLGRGLLAAVTS